MESDSNSSGYEEPCYSLYTHPFECLFCKEMYECCDELISHMKLIHQFNLIKINAVTPLDDYVFKRLVNFMRKKVAEGFKSSTELFQEFQQHQNSDELLLPFKEDDNLLMFDIEEYLEESNENSGLTRELKELKIENQRLQGALNEASNTVRDLREYTLRLLENKDPKSSEIQHSDEQYFTSYAHYGIHLDMLKDTIRTESYQQFFLKNSDLFKDKVVLEVGCGTGILSMFCVQAGAAHVYAIDKSDIAYSAIDIVLENNYENKITVIKSKIEDVKLDVKVDIIISEWMGYFLLFECMLDSILSARSLFLKPDTGKVYPQFFQMFLVGINDEELLKYYFDYWSDVYGFKMNCMKSDVQKEAIVTTINPESLVTDAFCIKSIDANSVQDGYINFSSTVRLVFSTSSTITAICGYFDTVFDSDSSRSTSFSTGPLAPSTHWKQVVFFLKTPLNGLKGDVMEFEFSCCRDSGHPRGLKLTIKTDSEHSNYFLS